MSTGSILWTCDRGTRAKLKILHRYLGAWFSILGSGSVQDVIYFDGFCGPGEYAGGEKGSPVVATEHANAAAERNSSLHVHIVCVDKRSDAIEHLQGIAAIRNHHPRVSIDIRRGEFGSEILQIVGGSEYKRHWPIFSFVDPFGFSGFSQETLRFLMRNQSSEIFVNLFCGYMNRFVEHHDEQVRAWIADLIGAANLPRVRAATDGIAEICDLFREFLQTLGPYVRRFMMRDENNTRDNALFFCSRNERGLQKIKEAMWKVDPVFGASFSEHAAKKSGGGFDLTEPQTSELRRLLVERFSRRSDVGVGELERWTIIETATFLPSHLRKELEILHSQNRITYVDPHPTGRKRQSGHWPSRFRISFRSDNV